MLRFGRGTIHACAMALAVALPSMPAAEPGPQYRVVSSAVKEISIRNHRGGFLPKVVSEAQRLARAGIRVRIDGGFCFSACTLFLSLEHVCVAPWTQFGFHAPQDPRTGKFLSGPSFESVTRFVAGHYRPPLAEWWLREGRHVRTGLALRSGAELIAMGYPACPRAAG